MRVDFSAGQGEAVRILILLALFVGTAFAAPGKPTVTLTWHEVTPGVTFNIYRGSVAGVCAGSPTPFMTGVTNPSYIDTTVTPGLTYVYAVSAVKGGESACSNEAQITVPTAPAPPDSLQGTSP